MIIILVVIIIATFISILLVRQPSAVCSAKVNTACEISWSAAAFVTLGFRTFVVLNPKFVVDVNYQSSYLLVWEWCLF